MLLCILQRYFALFKPRYSPLKNRINNWTKWWSLLGTAPPPQKKKGSCHLILTWRPQIGTQWPWSTPCRAVRGRWCPCCTDRTPCQGGYTPRWPVPRSGPCPASTPGRRRIPGRRGCYGTPWSGRTGGRLPWWHGSPMSRCSEVFLYHEWWIKWSK